MEKFMFQNYAANINLFAYQSAQTFKMELSINIPKIFLLLLSIQPNWALSPPAESHDYNSTNFCEHFYGEYFRDHHCGFVCCGNDTLKLPEEFMSSHHSDKVYQECSLKFRDDKTSDLPTGMWNNLLCELRESKLLKPSGITFKEVSNFITKHYPKNIKDQLDKKSSKCSDLDSKKMDDNLKLEKLMECFYDAEHKTCHKPFGDHQHEHYEEDEKRTKELGCPVVHGLSYQSSVEYCCKKRSTPYPIMEFPAVSTMVHPDKEDALHQCDESFNQRITDLASKTKKTTRKPKSNQEEDDYHHDDHNMMLYMCHEACLMEQKNYTKSVLKLDFEAVAKFYMQDLSNNVKSEMLKILNRRKTEKILAGLDMGIYQNSTSLMTMKEYSDKFTKASELEKIQYYCRFVTMIYYEERRALHEYCFNETIATTWGNMHSPFALHAETDHEHDTDSSDHK